MGVGTDLYMYDVVVKKVHVHYLADFCSYGQFGQSQNYIID